jgi:hypothetical protein
VLVPVGRKKAIDALLASVQQGNAEAGVLFAQQPEKTLHELQVSPLEISPIDMKPLADVSEESHSQDERTR